MPHATAPNHKAALVQVQVAEPAAEPEADAAAMSASLWARVGRAPWIANVFDCKDSLSKITADLHELSIEAHTDELLSLSTMQCWRRRLEFPRKLESLNLVIKHFEKFCDLLDRLKTEAGANKRHTWYDMDGSRGKYTTAIGYSAAVLWGEFHSDLLSDKFTDTFMQTLATFNWVYANQRTLDRLKAANHEDPDFGNLGIIERIALLASIAEQPDSSIGWDGFRGDGNSWDEFIVLKHVFVGQNGMHSMEDLLAEDLRFFRITTKSGE